MQDVQEPMTRRQKREKKKLEARKEMWAWIREIIAVVVAVMLIKTFLFEIITVEGGSMLNTLRTGDRMYVSILSAKIEGYQRGDIVICYYPGRTDRCVKRIVALPGDSVEIIQGAVYVNGELQEEEYIEYKALYSYPPYPRKTMDLYTGPVDVHMEQEIELVPYGCTNLRISYIPRARLPLAPMPYGADIWRARMEKKNQR